MKKVMNLKKENLVKIEEETEEAEKFPSCSECIYYPDKAPCYDCEGYSNFIEVPF